MLTALVLAKILVTLVAVVGLSLIAEHVSPRLAGILAGYPHGIAIVLYFIGVEQGVEFAARAAVFAIGGLSANMALAFVYAHASRGRSWANLGRAAGLGLAAFLAAALGLRLISPGPAGAVLITLGTLVAAAMWMRREREVTLAEKPKVQLSDMLARATLAALIVLAITGLAGLIGPGWSGLLAGFPVVTFPFLLIVHRKHGPAPIRTIVKAYPLGLTSLIVYTLTTAAAFPPLGVGWGTVAGFGAATAWLLALSLWRERRAQ